MEYRDRWRTPSGVPPELATHVFIRIDAETADDPAEPATVDVAASEEEFGADITLNITVPGVSTGASLNLDRARELWEALGVAMRYVNIRQPVKAQPAPAEQPADVMGMFAKLTEPGGLPVGHPGRGSTANGPDTAAAPRPEPTSRSAGRRR
jgi:hypothetical protein